MKLLLSDLYKIFKSKLSWLHLLVPLGVVIIFCAYYSYSPWEETDKIIMFFQSISRGFPLAAATVVAMLYDMDRKAGNCQNLLLFAGARWKVHIANLVALLIYGFGATMFAAVSFKAGFTILGFHTGTFFQMTYFGLLCFVLAIGVYILQYIICFGLGTGPSLTIGILGTLLCTLIFPGKGETLWKFIPYMQGVRLFSFRACHVLRPELDGNFSGDYKYGYLWAIGTVVVLLVCFIVLTSVWQGNGKTAEE